MKTFSESLKEYILNLNPENKTITGEVLISINIYYLYNTAYS
jgi:hypothetical protein